MTAIHKIASVWSVLYFYITPALKFFKDLKSPMAETLSSETNVLIYGTAAKVAKSTWAVINTKWLKFYKLSLR